MLRSYVRRFALSSWLGAGLAAATPWAGAQSLVSQSTVVQSTATPPDDATAVQRLMQSGQSAQAMVKVDQALVLKPRDPRLRFLRAVLLAEADRPDEAIRIYRELSNDYPELPEPYNNRAVIHAAQGDFDLAREQLELALRAHPGYAVAQQNLGDVYLQLSRRAYMQALALDPTNTQIPPKLAALRELNRSQIDAAAAAAAAARIAR